MSDRPSSEPLPGAGLARVRALVVAARDETRATIVPLLAGRVGRIEARPDATGALAALRAAAAVGDPVQLVVVDGDPGGMSQSDLVAAIRADGRLAGIGVLALTTPVDEAALVDAAAAVMAGRPAGSGAWPGQHRILVVEDDPVSQKVAVAYLERLGYRAEVARDGPSALQALAGGTFDAILMDCQIPLLDGYATTAEIRRHEGEGRHVPIVAMTSSESEPDRRRCLAAGMDDHVAKPLRGPALAAALARWLVPGAAAAEPGPAPVDPGDDRVDEATLAEVVDLAPGAAIVTMFLSQAAATIEQLSRALNAGDHLDGARIAHTLRGSAGSFGARRVARLSGDVEAACARPDLQAGRALLTQIEAEFDAFRALVRSRLAAGPEP